jgi:hypothetical protein
LRGRFHHDFFDLALREPLRQGSQLRRAGAHRPAFKEKLAIDLDVGHYDGEHLLVHIDARDPIRHRPLPGASGERAFVTLLRVAGYRRSAGNQRRPIICSNTHAPDQPIERSRLHHWSVDLTAVAPRTF